MVGVTSLLSKQNRFVIEHCWDDVSASVKRSRGRSALIRLGLGLMAPVFLARRARGETTRAKCLATGLSNGARQVLWLTLGASLIDRGALELVWTYSPICIPSLRLFFRQPSFTGFNVIIRRSKNKLSCSTDQDILDWLEMIARQRFVWWGVPARLFPCGVSPLTNGRAGLISNTAAAALASDFNSSGRQTMTVAAHRPAHIILINCTQSNNSFLRDWRGARRASSLAETRGKLQRDDRVSILVGRKSWLTLSGRVFRPPFISLHSSLRARGVGKHYSPWQILQLRWNTIRTSPRASSLSLFFFVFFFKSP